MIKGSLLEVYKKYRDIKSVLNLEEIHKKLETRLKFYEQEEMIDEYSEVYAAMQELSLFYYALDSVFEKPFNVDNSFYQKYGWAEYFYRADQVLYDEDMQKGVDGIGVKNFYSNDLIMQVVVDALNKEYPNEKWKFGDLPIYIWRQLNYPGREMDDETIARWKNSKNVTYNHYNYYEHDSEVLKCLYQEELEDEIFAANEENPFRLKQVCEKAKTQKKLYVVHNEFFLINECQDINSNLLNVEFIEDAKEDVYGRCLTEREKVINNAIVNEIDKQCANKPEIKRLHKKLDEIRKNIIEFLERNNLKIDVSKLFEEVETEEEKAK